MNLDHRQFPIEFAILQEIDDLRLRQLPRRERSDRRERSASRGDCPRADCSLGQGARCIIEPKGSTEGLVLNLLEIT